MGGEPRQGLNLVRLPVPPRPQEWSWWVLTPRPPVCKTGALPLSYSPLVAGTGADPVAPGV